MGGVDWSYPLACIWGLGVVAACGGWGVLLGRVLALNPVGRPLPFGLAGALGMACFIFASGPLLLFGLFGRIPITLFLVVGVVLAVGWRPARETIRRLPWPARRDMQFVAVLVLLWILFLLAKAAANRHYTEYDDFRAYFPFVRMMLDTGSFLDPFSFRRLSALGGQSALETLTLAYLPWKYGNLLDWGIAAVVLAIMVYEQVEGDTVPVCLGRCGLVIVAVTYPVEHLNTTSSLTTAVMMLALLRSLDFITDRALPGWKGALLVAAFAGALSTLRAQNLFAAGLMLAAFFAFRWWTDREQRPEVVRQAARTFGATVLFLASWMIVLQLSSGTPLYPLIHGNHQPGFDVFSGKLPPLALASFVARFFLDVSFGVLFLPVFFMASRRHRDTALVLSGCLLLISLAMVLKFTSSNAENLHRYLIPLALGLALYTGGHVVRRFASSTQPSQAVTWSFAAVAVVLLGMIAWYRVGHSDPFSRLRSIELGFEPRYAFALDHVPPLVSLDGLGEDYADALAKVPKGARVLTSVDFPFLLDYRGHRFYNVDIYGVASPSPGMPYFQGSAAVKNYLLGQGIDYIAYSPFDRALFLDSIRAQTEYSRAPDLLTRQSAKFALEFMKNVDELAATNPIPYQDDRIRIVQLTKP